jgi:hypothetical protein
MFSISAIPLPMLVQRGAHCHPEFSDEDREYISGLVDYFLSQFRPSYAERTIRIPHTNR